jgi:thymidylate synthase
LYNNHISDDIVYEQLTRTPKNLPTLRISRRPDSIFGYELQDFEFEGYDPHPRIVAPIAV